MSDEDKRIRIAQLIKGMEINKNRLDSEQYKEYVKNAKNEIQYLGENNYNSQIAEK
jgi:hypothetical protein